jgi:hypothetical protein
MKFGGSGEKNKIGEDVVNKKDTNIIKILMDKLGILENDYVTWKEGDLIKVNGHFTYVQYIYMHLRLLYEFCEICRSGTNEPDHQAAFYSELYKHNLFEILDRFLQRYPRASGEASWEWSEIAMLCTDILFSVGLPGSVEKVMIFDFFFFF